MASKDLLQRTAATLEAASDAYEELIGQAALEGNQSLVSALGVLLNSTKYVQASVLAAVEVSERKAARHPLDIFGDRKERQN